MNPGGVSIGSGGGTDEAVAPIPAVGSSETCSWRESPRGDHKKKEVLEGVVDGQIVRSVV